MTTTFPFTTCCQMLAVAPKTLRHWLSQAAIEPTGHNTDSRLKLLTLEQLYQLAILHRRTITPPTGSGLEGAVEPSLLQTAQELLPLEPIRDPTQEPEGSVCLSQEEEWRGKLSHVEAKLATVQEQLTQLALSLLQERDLRSERRIAALEALVQQFVELRSSQQVRKVPPLSPSPDGGQSPGRGLNPVEPRIGSRMLPLIEYGASDQYVVICPTVGELSLTPESPEWFDWLASLSSFRFVGQQGRFTAYRHSRSSRSWRAHRTIHQRTYKYTLGVTDHLTISRLEQVAAALQAHMASL